MTSFVDPQHQETTICCRNQDCVVPENIYTPSPSPPPLLYGGQRNFRGERVQKEAISEGLGGGWPLQSFFRGFQVRLMSKLSPILLYFGVSKQKIIVFFSMIFYFQSADYFFSRACTMVNVTRLSCNI